MDLKFIKKNIYVLNINELKKICNKLNIDHNIYIEMNNGIKKINDQLHKEFIINKIIKVLGGKKDKKIIYLKLIQNYNSTIGIKSTDFVYYGQYNTTDTNIKNLLKKLTNKKFKFGAISQKIVKKYWLKNKLVSYDNFAKEWLKEYSDGNINYDELAYNKFMKKYGDKKLWFEKKKEIVSKFKNMKLL